METATASPPKRPERARQLLGGPGASPRSASAAPARPPASLPRRRSRRLRPRGPPGGSPRARRGDTRAGRASPTCRRPLPARGAGRDETGRSGPAPVPAAGHRRGAVERGPFKRARGGRGGGSAALLLLLPCARRLVHAHGRARRSPSPPRSLTRPGPAASRRSRWRALLPSARRHWLTGVS